MDYRAEYSSKGFCHVREAVPREVADVLLLLIEKSFGNNPKDFGHTMAAQPINTKTTIEMYADKFYPLMTFQWGMTALMSEIAGHPVLPSFGTFRVYQQGDLCKIHSDRKACQHSLNITLGYADDIRWGLNIGANRLAEESTGEGRVLDHFDGEAFSTIEMTPGDAVAYQGVYYRHGRLTANPNRWSAHFFMNFVDQDGPYSAHAFDQRKPKAKAEFYF